MKRALCFTALFFPFLLKFASSLIPAQTSVSDPLPLPISPLSTHSNNNSLVVVTCDGSMSLVDLDLNRINWTYKSGVPTYSSYQAPGNVGTYIDVGLDWELYLHDKSKGISQIFGSSVKDFVRKTPFSVNGTTVIGQMKTSVTILDAKTGKLVHTLSPLHIGIDGGNPMLLGESDELLLEPGDSSKKSDGSELFYVTRTDYAFMAYSENRSVLWNFMCSDITVEISSGSYKRSIIVYRSRECGYPDHLSLGGSVDRKPYSLPGYKELALYSAKESSKQLSIPHQGHPIAPHSGVKQNLLALTSFESIAMAALALPINDVSKNEDNYARQPAWLSVMVLSLFLVLIIVFAIRHYFVVSTSNKQEKDLKLKPLATKKRKTRKSGTGKNNAESEGTSVTLAYPSMSLSGLIGGDHMEGRQIGKLYISGKEIAKGSNGTVVLEGIYDSRPVAIKRLVQTHHDVALKEIQNLIASDKHPNIVRWYGMEFDSDFVYLSLERCNCNLSDLISLYSQSSKDSDSHFVQLQQRVGNIEDFELWRVNGYPSTQLLKLMRDVVSGLAHLHEIGIIHRDLKPQNVLIIKEKSMCAKLSDMGISKRLDGDMTSLTQHATGMGSSGWRAPEQLKNGRQTRALDLFSLGCVLFFCMTGGRHPFGDSYERDANIVNDRKDLFLVDNIPEALHLITHLLDPNPDLRPKAVEVLDHPLFWNSDTRLSFLRDVSDRVELEDRECESPLLEALESVASKALGGKWDEKLDNSFLGNIGRYRRYKYDSVRDLLRVVRNKLNHYRELPKDIQESLGSVPEGFDHYFTSRFPRLLMEVYKVIRMYCEGEELLNKYFKSTVI